MIRKVMVAAIEALFKADAPHMPCPEVQPQDILTPNPTSNPPNNSLHKLTCVTNVEPLLRKNVKIIAPRIKPAEKNNLHTRESL